MTTQSKRMLGRNKNRAKTKGAFGGASSSYRASDMVERTNAAFNEKLEKMRKKKQEKLAAAPIAPEPVKA